MKNFKSAFLFLILITLLYPKSGFSLDFKNTNSYMVDTRGDDGDIYLNRITVNKHIESFDTNINLFSEIQFNRGTEEWEKLNIGIGATKFLNKYFYIEQSIETINGEILDHLPFRSHNISLDTISKIGIKIPIVKNLCLDIKEEYAINIMEGRGEYCESIAEAIYSFKKLDFALGWRHTDRIHVFDSDYVTFSISIGF